MGDGYRYLKTNLKVIKSGIGSRRRVEFLNHWGGNWGFTGGVQFHMGI